MVYDVWQTEACKEPRFSCALRRGRCCHHAVQGVFFRPSGLLVDPLMAGRRCPPRYANSGEPCTAEGQGQKSGGHDPAAPGGKGLGALTPARVISPALMSGMPVTARRRRTSRDCRHAAYRRQARLADRTHGCAGRAGSELGQTLGCGRADQICAI